jgi:hypothetical protein
VKNHDFTPKNHIFPMAEGGAKIVGVFRVKNHDFTPKNHDSVVCFDDSSIIDIDSVVCFVFYFIARQSNLQLSDSYLVSFAIA